MESKQVETRLVGTELVALESADGVPRLRNTHSGVALPVSQLEAEAFLWSSHQDFHRFFIKEGALTPDGSGATSRLTAIAAGLSHGLPLTARLGCLVDQTVLRTAVVAIENDWPPSPVMLMDLSTICYAVVLYDYVAMDIDPSWIPPELEGIVLSVRLRDDPRNEVHPHYNMAVSIASMLDRHPELLTDLSKSWESFLGHSVSIDYEAVNEATNSPGVWDYIPGNGGNDDPIGHLLDERQQTRHPNSIFRELNESVSIQTWRYFINERTAAFLGLPYNCTGLRYPVDHIALARKVQYRWLGDELLTTLTGEPPRSSGISQGRWVGATTSASPSVVGRSSASS